MCKMSQLCGLLYYSFSLHFSVISCIPTIKSLFPYLTPIMDNFPTLADSVFTSFEIDKSYLPQSNNEEERFRELRAVLIRRIEELIEKDTEKLMWILYRIDVNEKKVHESLSANSSLVYPEVLADLIIERQIEKAKTRKQFNDSGTADWSFDV